jgi:hypothetical protein
MYFFCFRSMLLLYYRVELNDLEGRKRTDYGLALCLPNRVSALSQPQQSCRSSRGSAFITTCRKQPSVPSAVSLYVLNMHWSIWARSTALPDLLGVALSPYFSLLNCRVPQIVTYPRPFSRMRLSPTYFHASIFIATTSLLYALPTRLNACHIMALTLHKTNDQGMPVGQPDRNKQP